MFVSIWNAQLSESEIKYYLSIYLSIYQPMLPAKYFGFKVAKINAAISLERLENAATVQACCAE